MHHYFLHKALELAKIRQGFCFPNPSVGALLVNQGEIVGQGFHLGAGHAHAEIVALEQAGQRAKGATLYVTLEPCCHTGRTPPCTEALIKAGISKVYYAYCDPNPIINGRGEQALTKSGIACQYLPLEEVDMLYRAYRFWHQFKLPWVTLKLAISLDGKIANKDGRPVTLTGPDLKIFTYQGRKAADGILTTIRTIINDDPALNVRLDGNIFSKPLFILDSELQLPVTAQVLQTCSKVTVFYNQKKASQRQLETLEHHNVECVAISDDNNGYLSLKNILYFIGERGLHTLWVEAGGRCFESFIKEKLAQQVYLYIAPQFLGHGKLDAIQKTLKLVQDNAQVCWKNVGQDGVCEISWPVSN